MNDPKRGLPANRVDGSTFDAADSFSGHTEPHTLSCKRQFSTAPIEGTSPGPVDIQFVLMPLPLGWLSRYMN